MSELKIIKYIFVRIKINKIQNAQIQNNQKNVKTKMHTIYKNKKCENENAHNLQRPKKM